MLKRRIKVAFFRKKSYFVELYKKVMNILYTFTALNYVFSFKRGIYGIEHAFFIGGPQRSDKLSLCPVPCQSMYNNIFRQYAYALFKRLYITLHIRQAEFARGVILFKVSAGKHMQQLKLYTVSSGFSYV